MTALPSTIFDDGFARALTWSRPSRRALPCRIQRARAPNLGRAMPRMLPQHSPHPLQARRASLAAASSPAVSSSASCAHHRQVVSCTFLHYVGGRSIRRADFDASGSAHWVVSGTVRRFLVVPGMTLTSGQQNEFAG